MTRAKFLGVLSGLMVLPSQTDAACMASLTPAAQQHGKDAIIIAVPVAFTRADYIDNTPEQWHRLQGRLIENAMHCYWNDINREIRRRGWTRS